MLDRLPTCPALDLDGARDRFLDRNPIEPANPIVITAIPITIKPIGLSLLDVIGVRDRITVGMTIATLIGVDVGAGVIVTPGTGVDVGGIGVGIGGGGGNCNSP